MHLIVCVDKNNGMMFNGRRQSQDSELRRKVLELCGRATLWMNEYSAKQFENEFQIVVDEDFINKTIPGEYCFVEDGILPYVEDIETLYVFNWNRKYPADVFFELDVKDAGFKRISKEEFIGNSHEKITLEVFKR